MTTPTNPPRVRFWDRLLDPSRIVVEAVQREIVPAWRQVTEGESTVPVAASIGLAIVLQVLLPDRIVQPVRWLFPVSAFLLLVVIIAANGKRFDRPSRLLRAATLLLILIMSAANTSAAARLINDLLHGRGLRDAGDLILTGGAIWLTNVIIFALWYWMFDRGGPVARARGARAYPDFLFPQMASGEVAKPGWRPEFFDYLYTSFTNATAFSPTDTMPMSRWAKLTMMLQSAVALLLAILVIARAVNVLR
ncbi:MAG: hypothetical protein WD271_15535 [Acidimicrobiia bacterium]